MLLKAMLLQKLFMIRNKLAEKVNNIAASEFVLKTETEIDKTELKFLMQLILLKNQNLLN